MSLARASRLLVPWFIAPVAIGPLLALLVALEAGQAWSLDSASFREAAIGFQVFLFRVWVVGTVAGSAAYVIVRRRLGIVAPQGPAGRPEPSASQR